LALHRPLLPGHGERPQALLGLGYADWLQFAEERLLEVGGAGPAVLAGLSLGGLLALDLAAHHPERVAGLILLAPALWLREPHPDWTISLTRRLRIPERLLPKPAGPDLRDPRARAANAGYRAQPLGGIQSVQLAGRRCRQLLARITCPTLVLQGARDRVVHPQTPWRLAEGLGSQDCRVVLLAGSGHLLGEDVDHLRAEREIRGWLLERLPSVPGGRSRSASAGTPEP